MTTVPLQNVTSRDVFQDHIEPFLENLRVAGYAKRTLRKKRSVLKALARWTRRKRKAADFLNDDQMEAFLGRQPQKRKARRQFERAILRLFFEYLRSGAPLPSRSGQEDSSAADRLLRAYESYLRKDRGLTENSVHVYVPFIRG